MKKNLIFRVLGVALIAAGTAACDNTLLDGTYDFVIYESDFDNSNLTDNKVISSFTITYSQCSTVVDTLIKDGNRYYFDVSKADYIVMEPSTYGLMYKKGYFSDYSECKNGEIDVSMSGTYINGKMAMVGISDVSLLGLVTYGFVVNAWAM